MAPRPKRSRQARADLNQSAYRKPCEHAGRDASNEPANQRPATFAPTSIGQADHFAARAEQRVQCPTIVIPIICTAAATATNAVPAMPSRGRNTAMAPAPAAETATHGPRPGCRTEIRSNE